MKEAKGKKIDPLKGLKQNRTCEFWRCEQGQPKLDIFLDLELAIYLRCYYCLGAGDRAGDKTHWDPALIFKWWERMGGGEGRDNMQINK